MRYACAANSVKVNTTRSGAPSTDIDPIEPENIPTSKPRSSAMRAEIASYTDAGCTQRLPERMARKRSRRSVQFIVSHPRLFGRILPIAPLLVFNRLLFDLIELVEADQRLDFVPGGDAVLLAEAAVFAVLLQLHQCPLRVMEADQQGQQGVDASLVAHLGQLLPARGRTVVTVAEAADIDQRNLRGLRRLLKLLRRARENHPHVAADIGRHVDPGHRFVEPFESAGIASRDDHA